MIARLKALFLGPSSGGSADDGALELPRAAAALMALTARLDGHVEAIETATIRRVVERNFHISPEAAAELMVEADRVASEATDLFSLTEEINSHLEPEKRVSVIEMLWEVAFADGELSDFEANLLRRAAGLLYVSDRDNGEARKRALERLGLDLDTGL
jgi:uncharacterized tellurite resistance protein B-like protein